MNRVKYNFHYILDSFIAFMTFFLNKTGCPTDITQKRCVRRLGWVRMIGFMKKVKRKGGIVFEMECTTDELLE